MFNNRGNSCAEYGPKKCVCLMNLEWVMPERSVAHSCVYVYTTRGRVSLRAYVTVVTPLCFFLNLVVSV